MHHAMDIHVLIDDYQQQRQSNTAQRSQHHGGRGEAAGRAQGLLPRDIGQLLELDPKQVRQFMEDAEKVHDKYIKFAIPEPEETVSAFRRGPPFSTIRMAIQQAQIDGHIDVETSANCPRALAAPEQPS